MDMLDAVEPDVKRGCERSHGRGGGRVEHGRHQIELVLMRGDQPVEAKHAVGSGTVGQFIMFAKELRVGARLLSELMGGGGGL